LSRIHWMNLRWAVAAVMMSVAAGPTFAALRVSPGVVEARFENGRTSGSFTITSTDSKTQRLRVFPVHFHLNLDGQVNITPIDSSSLANWIKITPREFTLEPNSERQIRYAIMAPDSVPDGSYWGALEFLPLPSHQDSLTAMTTLKAIAVVVVPILADKGKPVYVWNLDPDSMRSIVTPDGVVLLAKVENDGTGRVAQKGHYEIRDSGGNVVKSGDTDRGSVLPHSVRYLKTTVPKTLAAGSYEYEVTYTSEMDGSKLSGALRFDVPATYPDPPEKKQR
jgi:P pilus assembly chaperone PapD